MSNLVLQTDRQASRRALRLGQIGDAVDIECLKGKICTRVYEHYPQNFTFEFSDVSLAVDCLWRIKVDGRVALTSRDHGQQFGLPGSCGRARRC